jgi:hypothetical protein
MTRWPNRCRSGDCQAPRRDGANYCEDHRGLEYPRCLVPGCTEIALRPAGERCKAHSFPEVGAIRQGRCPACGGPSMFRDNPSGPFYQPAPVPPCRRCRAKETPG